MHLSCRHAKIGHIGRGRGGKVSLVTNVNYCLRVWHNLVCMLPFVQNMLRQAWQNQRKVHFQINYFKQSSNVMLRLYGNQRDLKNNYPLNT